MNGDLGSLYKSSDFNGQKTPLISKKHLFYKKS